MRLIVVLALASIVTGCAAGGQVSPEPSAGTSSPSPTADPTPSPSPTAPGSATPGPSPTPSPTAVPLEVTDWHSVDLPSQDLLYQLYGPAWTGKVFVVAGVMRGSTPGENDGIRFWTSPDGEVWSMADERSWGYVRDYAFQGDGQGLAVGFLGSSAAIWTSPDHRHWTKTETAAAFFDLAQVGELWAVAHGPGGYLAVGDSLVLSLDGVSWKLVDFPLSDAVHPVDLAVVGQRYVLVDSSGLWTSADGLAWDEVSSIGSSIDGVGLAAGAHGALLVQFGPQCRAMRSSDGLAWLQLDDPCPPVQQLLATPWGFLALAYGFGVSGDLDSTERWACGSGIWATTDGGRWECLASPVAWPLDGISASDDVVIVIDRPREIPGSYTVWRGEVRLGAMP